MARPNRIKLDGEGYYHVIDRIAHREFLLRDERIKRRLLDLMRRAAEFSGVDVCTYVIMDNHLHLCVHVPEAGEIDERTVVERVGTLYGEPRAAALRAELERLRAAGRETDAVRKRKPLRVARRSLGTEAGGVKGLSPSIPTCCPNFSSVSATQGNSRICANRAWSCRMCSGTGR